jgi:hypothetical protein
MLILCLRAAKLCADSCAKGPAEGRRAASEELSRDARAAVVPDENKVADYFAEPERALGDCCADGAHYVGDGERPVWVERLLGLVHWQHLLPRGVVGLEILAAFGDDSFC